MNEADEEALFARLHARLKAEPMRPSPGVPDPALSRVEASLRTLATGLDKAMQRLDLLERELDTRVETTVSRELAELRIQVDQIDAKLRNRMPIAVRERIEEKRRERRPLWPITIVAIAAFILVGAGAAATFWAPPWTGRLRPALVEQYQRARSMVTLKQPSQHLDEAVPTQTAATAPAIPPAPPPARIAAPPAAPPPAPPAAAPPSSLPVPAPRPAKAADDQASTAAHPVLLPGGTAAVAAAAPVAAPATAAPPAPAGADRAATDEGRQSAYASPPPPPRPQTTEQAMSQPSLTVLRIRATARSWVEVMGDGRRPLIRRLFQPGETWEGDSPGPLLLSTGNAAALVVLVDGKPFALPGPGVLHDVPVSGPG